VRVPASHKQRMRGAWDALYPRRRCSNGQGPAAADVVETEIARSSGVTLRSDAGKARQKRVYTVRTMSSSVRSRRIDVRVSDEQDAIIREAAAASGQTVTAFLLSAAEERARTVLDHRRHLVMSDRAFAAFASALDAPGERVAPLGELFSLPRLSRE
jgi:uncharacterized protein (DUF1778 family)